MRESNKEKRNQSYAYYYSNKVILTFIIFFSKFKKKVEKFKYSISKKVHFLRPNEYSMNLNDYNG